MKTAITSIRIKLKSQEINIDADEARELHYQLRKLFESHEAIVKTELDQLNRLTDMQPIQPSQYVPVPYPIYIEKIPTYIPPWTITCEATSASGTPNGMTGATLCLNVSGAH